MISISDILVPEHVNLALAATTPRDAVEEVMGKLHGDPRVGDFGKFAAAVIARDAPALDAGGLGICIAHGRTDAVDSLVMAAGRSQKGVRFRDVRVPVKLVFVAGIPSAFDSEYLRIVGVIARLCREPSTAEALLAAPDGAAFVGLLEAASVKL